MSDSKLKRRLAAVVFVDIVGYTKHANQDESKALDFRRRVENSVKSCAHLHSGVVIKTIGDGVMMEFSSVVEAVSCSLDIQQQISVMNVELCLPSPLLVRVGVHVGEVVEEDGDIYGNTVNIASRIQGMATPGGICMSREVYTQIRPILKLSFKQVQPSSGKAIPEAMDVFEIATRDGGAPLKLFPLRPISLIAGLAVFCCIGLLIVQSPRFWSRSDDAQPAANSSAKEIAKETPARISAPVGNSVISFALFAPGVPEQDKRALKNILAGEEDPESVSLVSSLADGIRSTNSVLVLVLGDDRSSQTGTYSASALKRRKVLGIGYGAAQVFEEIGLKIGAGNCAHGVRDEPRLLLQTNSTIPADRIDSPFSIFVPPILDQTNFHSDILFGVYIGDKHPEVRQGLDIVALYSNERNYTPVVRQNDFLLVCVNFHVSNWSPSFQRLIRESGRALARPGGN